MLDLLPLPQLPLLGLGLQHCILEYLMEQLLLALPVVPCRQQLAEELRQLERLQSDDHGIAVPRLYASSAERHAFVRDFLELPCLLNILEDTGGSLSPTLETPLWTLFEIAR